MPWKFRSSSGHKHLHWLDAVNSKLTLNDRWRLGPLWKRLSKIGYQRDANNFRFKTQQCKNKNFWQRGRLKCLGSVEIHVHKTIYQLLWSPLTLFAFIIRNKESRILPEYGNFDLKNSSCWLDVRKKCRIIGGTWNIGTNLKSKKCG